MSSMNSEGETPRSSWQRPDAPLGTLIFREGLLSAEQLEDALGESVKRGKRLGQVLVERGLLEEAQVARILARQKGLDYVDLRETPVDPAAASLVSSEIAWLTHTVPIAVVEGTPLVAVEDPGDEEALRKVAETLGTQPRFAVATRSEILRVLGSTFDGSSSAVAPAAPVAVAPPAPAAQPAPEPAPVAPAEQPPAPAPQPAVTEATGLRVAAPPPEPPAEVVSEPPVEVVSEPQVAPQPEPVAETPVEPSPAPPTAPEPSPAPAAEVAPEPEPASVAPPPAVQAAPVEPAPQTVSPPEQPGATVEPPPEQVHEAPPEPAPVVEPVPEPEPVQATPPAPEEPPAAPLPPVVEFPPPTPPAAEPPPAPEPPPAAEAPLALHLAEPEPESEPGEFRVVVRLSDGESIEVDVFSSLEEAKGAAKLLTRQIGTAAPGEWPQLGGRYVRPDLIVSIDLL